MYLLTDIIACISVDELFFQDVSYVLSSVFGDLYSQDVLQDDTIINLETSRTHDPDFHDYYVQLLNEVKCLFKL